MAKTKKNSDNALVVADQNSGLPDYLDTTKLPATTGLEALGKEDFKVTRLKLLHPTNPEVRAFPQKALPSEFWHTGANVSVGASFFATPIIVNKRVILFAPRDAGNDKSILAISKNGLNWDVGANTEHEVKLKTKKKVLWKVGKDVKSSGLLDFGSGDPEDSQSAPAATLFYEYLLYLRDFPDLSPVVFSCYKTGIQNAKSFNTYLASRRTGSSRVPINCNLVRIFSDTESNANNTYLVPRFEPAGNAIKEIYEITSKLRDEYSDFDISTDIDELQESTTELKYDDI